MKRAKCNYCNEVQPLNKFYITKAGKPSPYCIACNTEAVMMRRYKTFIKRHGHAAFEKKIHEKYKQLQLMCRAAL